MLHRLRAHGAGTLNARTERELTVTLPNHTGMVTGRRVAAGHHGHGVTWNDARLRPRTVQDAAGHPVRSVFTVVHAAGRRSAVFASKPKFTLFERSWPTAVDRTVVRQDNARLVGLARRDLARRARAFTFVHLSLPDIVGHERGFMSPAYLDAVARVDGLVGRLLSTVRHDADLRGSTAVVLTADHGGLGAGHGDPTLLEQLPGAVPGLGSGGRGRREPLPAQPRLRRPREAAAPATPPTGSRCATATSPTWRPTCWGCPPYAGASSTPTRTSTSADAPRRRATMRDGPRRAPAPGRPHR